MITESKLSIEKGQKVNLGNSEMTFGDEIHELEDSSHLLHDAEALRARMCEDGFIYLRDFQSRDLVMNARNQILSFMDREGILKSEFDFDHAQLNDKHKGGRLFAHDDIRGFDQFLSLVESEDIMNFFTSYLGGSSRTYDYKWLRAVGKGVATGAHYDVVYMGRGTLNLYTCWTPLGDIPLDKGPLAVCAGSHKLQELTSTYGKMDVDRDHVSGWFSNEPREITEKYGNTWRTTNFRAGDVILFGMHTLHCSLTNQSEELRLSSDTRYQLQNDPVDERWVGQNPMAHYAWQKGETVPMSEARSKWGV